MPQTFSIYLDRLKTEKAHSIEMSVSADFLEVAETELKFLDPVHISGEAYLADDHFVLKLNASTSVQMPCAICNQMIPFPLSIEEFYHTEALKDLPSVFDFRLVLRENLLIEIPHTVECKGKCPERNNLSPFLRKSKDSADLSTHYPFSDIHL